MTGTCPITKWVPQKLYDLWHSNKSYFTVGMLCGTQKWVLSFPTPWRDTANAKIFYPLAAASHGVVMVYGHHTLISFGGKPVCNLRFVDDIDLMGGSNGELQDFTNRFVDRASVWKLAQKRARLWPTARTTSVQLLAWTARRYRRRSISSMWSNSAKLAHAQQKSASILPQ